MMYGTCVLSCISPQHGYSFVFTYSHVSVSCYVALKSTVVYALSKLAIMRLSFIGIRKYYQFNVSS